MRPVWPTLFLEFLICVTSCKSCICLDILRNLNITYGGPKTWNGYIRKFMQRNLDNFILYYTYHRRLLYFLKYSTLFVSVQKKFIFIDIKCVYSPALRVLYMDLHTYVKWPSGQFISEDSLECYYGCGSDTYNFRLSPSLRLNLSFYVIDTKFGTLEVGNLSAASPSFIYEGHFPTFNLYPRFNSLTIKLYYVGPKCHYDLFNINGSFTVMDRKVSYNVVINNVTDQQPDFQYTIKNEYFLFWYHLKVIKLNKILIVPSVMNIELGSKYIVYDGPGLLADASKNQRIKQCSTFQCIIHLLTHMNHSYVDIKYYTKTLLSLESVTISQEQLLSINLPNINCLDTVCTIAIHILDGYHVNVTINKLLRIGLYDETCLYGGLVASEQLTDDYRQSSTVCENYHGTKQPRSFYSHKSSLILILYWYKMYNTFNITVDISGTSCEPVNIDICHYEDACMDIGISRCLLYLNYVTQYSSINISTEATYLSETPFSHPILRLIPLQNKCFILALLQNETIRNIETCEIDMIPIRSQMKEMRSSEQGRIVPHAGYILIEWATRKVCSLQLCHLDTFNLFTIEGHTMDNVTINGKFQFNNIIHLLAVAYPYFKLWVDIILQKLNAEVMAITDDKSNFLPVYCPFILFIHSKQVVIVLQIVENSYKFTRNLSLLQGYGFDIVFKNYHKQLCK